MINKVVLIGRTGKEPEITYTQAGDMIASISLATTESWKDRNGEKKEKTEWHRVVFFRKLAEIVEKYVGKGDLLFIEGKITTRKWTDQQGVDRYSTEIIANEMKMLGNRGSQNREYEPQDRQGRAGSQQRHLAYSSDDDTIPF